jgi:hypothetical protein
MASNSSGRFELSVRTAGRARPATLAVAGAMALASAAAAAEAIEVALVESVTSNSSDVEFMDYVQAGQIIRLGPHGTIVLSYMDSCVRETITGGTVMIGTDQSDVQSGMVARTKVPCAPGKMLPQADRQAQVGGAIVRGMPSTSASAWLRIYGRAPIVELKAPGTLRIERIDQANERYLVHVTNEHLLNGRFYDFAKWGRNLAAGGVYSMRFGGEEIVFMVDPHAKPGDTPILGRLLRFRLPG